MERSFFCSLHLFVLTVDDDDDNDADSIRIFATRLFLRSCECVYVHQFFFFYQLNRLFSIQ